MPTGSGDSAVRVLPQCATRLRNLTKNVHSANVGVHLNGAPGGATASGSDPKAVRQPPFIGFAGDDGAVSIHIIFCLAA